MKYNKFRYIYPPRPKFYAIEDIESFQGDWYAQLKLNDTRSLIVVHPNGEIVLWNRHKEQQKAYRDLHPKLKEGLQSLNLVKGKFYIFDGLLMHNKTRFVKNTICLMDILVYSGKYLMGTSYEERYKLLQSICNFPDKIEQDSGLELGLEVSPLLWLSKNYEIGFTGLWKKWEKIKNAAVEGLVFKRKNGKLAYHFNNDKCDWQGKVRFSDKKT